MRIHFIAIGGSAMHNLALAMHAKGFIVSGSDDEIEEPSRSRLKQKGLLPEQLGWHPEKIDNSIDAIILGMHAREDNLELIKAKSLGIRIFSYPEYIYEQSKDKIRVVIGGSHGKTTIVSMILHVLKYNSVDCDYLVGAQLQGFETMVKLSNDAKVMIIEGDEYLSSPIDRRPKFHLYKPSIALLSGIAWDHINVFPTFENYVLQFEKFIDLIVPNGSLIYCQNDTTLSRITAHLRSDLTVIPYSIPAFYIKDGITYLEENNTPLLIFGEHNLLNLNGALMVCRQLGLSNQQFLAAIQSFKGAAKRMELLGENNKTKIYKDFAHSPSKLRATVMALKKQYPSRKLIACMELHTFSSLNESFLKEYNGSMELADVAFIYFNPHVIASKNLKPISANQVKEAFGEGNISIFTDSSELVSTLKLVDLTNVNLLLMSSGTFDGVNLEVLTRELLAS